MSGQYRRESIVQLVSPPLALHVVSYKKLSPSEIFAQLSLDSFRLQQTQIDMSHARSRAQQSVLGINIPSRYCYQRTKMFEFMAISQPVPFKHPTSNPNYITDKVKHCQNP